jgi:predicted transcriptional regulator
MSISKRDLANEELCKRAVSAYLSKDKPTLKDLAERLSVTFHTAQEMVRRGLDPETLKEEQALRYSRSKTGSQNAMFGKKNSAHPNYKGRLHCDPDGYVLILKPDWYTGRVGSKHVYEHQVVMAQLLGLTTVPDGMSVHHIDEDKTNNTPENLALVTGAAHRRLHASSPLRKLSLWELHRSGTSKSRKTTATSLTD